MMEGQPGTPDVGRLPDESTAFVKKKVEAPRRRQSQMRARKKRVAVMGLSLVTLLALAGVCAFLAAPSKSTEEVKTEVSEAMESDPTDSALGEVFVPSFDVYDEDGDGTVSLGEYLDRLAINSKAAVKSVKASSLNDTEKARIVQDLNDDFSTHSDCVALFAQQQGDEMMTRENFDQIYEKLTTEFCPLSDVRIPAAYQSSETATGQEELAPIQEIPDIASPQIEKPDLTNSDSPTASAVSSDTGSTLAGATSAIDESPAEESPAEEAPAETSTSVESSDPEWNPDMPVDVPTTVNSEDGAVEESPAEEMPDEEAPIEGSAFAEASDPEWNPGTPVDVPTTVKSEDGAVEEAPAEEAPAGASASAEASGPEWNPDKPVDVPTTANSGDGAVEESPAEEMPDEEAPIEWSAFADALDPEWNPDTPVDVPTTANSQDGAVKKAPAEDAPPATGSSPKVAAGWNPVERSTPPIVEGKSTSSEATATATSPESTDTKPETFSDQGNGEAQWQPNVPTDPPTMSISHDTQPAGSSLEPVEEKWDPGMPTNPPTATNATPENAPSQPSQPTGGNPWSPGEPTTPPTPSSFGEPASNQNSSEVTPPAESFNWDPNEPMNPPVPGSDTTKDVSPISGATQPQEKDQWQPEEPSNSPTLVSYNEGKAEEGITANSSPDIPARGNDKWTPKMPTDSPMSALTTGMNPTAASGVPSLTQWAPTEPAFPPQLFQPKEESIANQPSYAEPETPSKPSYEQPPMAAIPVIPVTGTATSAAAPSQTSQLVPAMPLMPEMRPQDGWDPQVAARGYASDPVAEGMLSEAERAWQAKKQARGIATVNVLP